ncbi:MAG TPA: histidine phosphatase family protein [Firmicutes bacterium]|nr:histidine phosphatase family protein [Bacillota bacterium]
MNRLYLIRHGETQWNKEMRFQGWTDIPLSETGREQAQKLAWRMRDIPIDEIYASPLQRAVETARPMAQLKGLSISTMQAFKEINFGPWEGMTAQEIREGWGESFVEFMKYPEAGTFPGEGSFDQVTERIRQGLDQVLEQKDGKNIAIVSHGGIVRLMIRYLMGFTGEWYNKTWIDNTSISIVEVRPKRGNLLRVLNDFSHLKNGVL